MKKLFKTILLGLVLFGTPALYANSNALVTLTDSNYLSKLLTSDKPVLVKFWASWCKPCQKMSPEFKKAARTFSGKVTFAEVNIDTAKQVASIYQVRSLPTIILFKKNKIIKRNIGSLNQKQIEKFVKNALK